MNKMVEKKFKNTFIQDCEKTELTVDEIITAMRFGFLDYEDLPEEVRGPVDEEIERMKRRYSQ
jgi:hypothetical protein